MTSRPTDPTRWKEGAADAHALERRAALLAEAAAEAPPALAADALARIRGQVVARRSRGGGRYFHGLSMPVRLALAAVVLLVSIATARGATVLWRWYAARAVAPVASPPAAVRRSFGAHATRAPAPSTPPLALQPVAPPVPPAAVPPPGARGGVVAPSAAARRALPAIGGAAPDLARGAGAASAPAVPAEAPPPAIAQAPMPSVPAAPVAAAREPGAFHAAPPAAGGRSPAAADTEAHLLAQALSQLRQSNDAHAALATLDRYARLYPHGVLESEARRTRIEIAIRLGDARTALALLDARPTAADALGGDLLIVRGELRANADRCADAVADFSQVLESAAATRGNPMEERALYGRAVCLSRLGQDARARADLVTYRRLFPAGKFSADVQRLLGGSTPGRP